MMYALLTANNDLIRIQDFDNAPPALASSKGLRWVPYSEVRPTAQVGQVEDGYVEGMAGESWMRSYTIRELTYAERRLTVSPKYAPLEEQLDMQFKDAINGTTTWRDHIVAVKAAHPKPEV